MKRKVKHLNACFFIFIDITVVKINRKYFTIRDAKRSISDHICHISFLMVYCFLPQNQKNRKHSIVPKAGYCKFPACMLPQMSRMDARNRAIINISEACKFLEGHADVNILKACYNKYFATPIWVFPREIKSKLQSFKIQMTIGP